MRWVIVSLVGVGACSGETNPYADGGDWPVAPCTTADLARAAADQTEAIGGTTRDFALFDQFAYKVRLSSFCRHTVLISVGSMVGEDDVAWLSRIPEIEDGVLPSAPPLTILTTWFRGPSGSEPDVGDLRRFADVHQLEVPVLRDRPRFENAARAASAFWLASDLGEPSFRYRQDMEVATRWRIAESPHFVVLHPGLRIVAAGADLDTDCLIEAAQTSPDLFVPCTNSEP